MTEELAEEPQEDRDGEAEEVLDDGEPATEHLQDLPDGSGCTEIWEHVAEQRADDD